jgi:hypothetical protein
VEAHFIHIELIVHLIALLKIINMNQHHILNESALQQAAANTRNKYIEEAYDQLVCRVSNILEISHSRAWNKFPRFEGKEVTHPNRVKEFYTPYCSVKLLVSRMNYIIYYTVTTQALNAGHGANSTALLRLAFECTQLDRNGFRIYDCLELSVDNDIERVYKQKLDERTDRQNQLYYNKKMGIEG